MLIMSVWEGSFLMTGGTQPPLSPLAPLVLAIVNFGKLMLVFHRHWSRLGSLCEAFLNDFFFSIICGSFIAFIIRFS